ncbi:MAG: low molecular weight phosphotyrosine protein phosphatase [Firmicutes bacterium]|nr:low molecular weight phosphotyrosine protein phosphatase [Bacillota bacterium]
MIKVLFVCLGNICRSPMAEGMLRKMIKDQGLESMIYVESRATSTWEDGNPPHPGTRKILDRIGADYTGKASTQIKDLDFIEFDYIIGMDHENIKYLNSHAGSYSNKIYLLRDIDPNTIGEIVPDPYFSGEHEKTYLLLVDALKLWLDKLKNESVLY